MLLVLLACAPEPEATICPSWSGFRGVGQRWDYEAFDGSDQWTSSLVALTEDEVVVRTGGREDTFRCDAEGVWLIGRDDSYEDGSWAAWDFEPPVLALPAELEPGLAWSMDAAWQYTDSTGVRRVESHTTQYEALDTSESHVAAGTFATLAIAVLDEDIAHDTQYRAEGVGVVLTDTAQLVEAVP